MYKWRFSNCFVAALIIKARLNGDLIMVKSAFSIIPHFMIKKGDRLIDFTCRYKDEPWYKELWFEGRIRVRNIEGIDTERRKLKFIKIC